MKNHEISDFLHQMSTQKCITTPRMMFSMLIDPCKDTKDSIGKLWILKGTGHKEKPAGEYIL